MISYFHPYQVEERYGGKAPNLTVFWPPVFPKLPVSLDYIHVDQVSPQEVLENPIAEILDLEAERQQEIERDYQKEQRRERRMARRELRERKCHTGREEKNEENEVKRKKRSKPKWRRERQ